MYPMRMLGRAMLRSFYRGADDEAMTGSTGQGANEITQLSEHDLERVFGGLCQPTFDEKVERLGIDVYRDL